MGKYQRLSVLKMEKGTCMQYKIKINLKNAAKKLTEDCRLSGSDTETI